MSRTVKNGMWIHRKGWIYTEEEFYKEIERFGYLGRRRKFVDYHDYINYEYHRSTNGSIGSVIGEPCSSCPKGYSWNDCWGPSTKRWAKTAVSGILRRRAKKEIRNILRELESED